MDKKRVVVALGGNALGNNAQEQLSLVKKTASAVVDLVEKGYDVVVGHGNGPQVGMINLAMSEYSSSHSGTSPMPFPECGAMSQGYIGYHLQQSIQNELNNRKIKKNVVTLVTQVLVDENDPAFSHPTKPIGTFYTKEQATVISEELGYTFIEDAGRGYRRVVPSPVPQKIVEIDIIDKLVNSGNIVITVGGGGIPVIESNSQLTGVSAVIDKDKSCALLASSLEADVLLILTAVDAVYINFNKANQKKLTRINKEETFSYIKDGQFAKGSMLPKIEACLDFIENRKDGISIITSLENAKFALDGNIGTVIYNKRNVVKLND